MIRQRDVERKDEDALALCGKSSSACSESERLAGAGCPSVATYGDVVRVDLNLVDVGAALSRRVQRDVRTGQ